MNGVSSKLLRITVELIPFGFERNKRTLCTAEICNDGTGTKARGNYRFSLSKQGKLNSNTWKTGSIQGFARKSRNAWHLLHEVLKEGLREI